MIKKLMKYKYKIIIILLFVGFIINQSIGDSYAYTQNWTVTSASWSGLYSGTLSITWEGNNSDKKHFAVYLNDTTNNRTIDTGYWLYYSTTGGNQSCTTSCVASFAGSNGSSTPYWDNTQTSIVIEMYDEDTSTSYKSQVLPVTNKVLSYTSATPTPTETPTPTSTPTPTATPTPSPSPTPTPVYVKLQDGEPIPTDVPRTTSFTPIPIVAGLTGSYARGSIGNTVGNHEQQVGYKVTFTSDVQICYLQEYWGYSGTPTDSLITYVRTSLTGDNILTTNAISVYNMSANGGYIQWQFGTSGYLGLNCPTLTAGTYYFMTKRTGTNDGSTYNYWSATSQSSNYNSTLEQILTSGTNEDTNYHLLGSLWGYGTINTAVTATENTTFRLPPINCGGIWGIQTLCNGLQTLGNNVLDIIFPTVIGVPQSQIDTTWALLQTKAPFAYGIASINGLKDLITPSTDVTTLTFTFRLPEPLATQVGLQNGYTFTQPAGITPIFTLIKDTLKIIIWLMIMFYLWWRIMRAI